MFKQIVFYNFEIIRGEDFSVQINALLLLIIILFCLIFRKKYHFLKYPLYLAYIFILLWQTKLLIINKEIIEVFDLDIFSKISLFIYNLLFLFKSSLTTYFMVYSYITIIVFMLFKVVFQRFRYFIIFVLSSQFLYLLLSILGISYHSISLYDIVLMFIGYGIGALLYRLALKGDKTNGEY